MSLEKSVVPSGSYDVPTTDALSLVARACTWPAPMWPDEKSLATT